MRVAAAWVVALGLPGFASAAQCSWPAWDNYKKAMVSADGRVIDHSLKQQITTSEGQSYGMFFALLANDRDSFSRLLQWTQDNLAGGDMSRQLPAWKWGQSKNGQWRVLDPNNASDADLWIAYSLLEAGRLWQRVDYEELGRNLLWRSSAQTVRKVPGLGLVMLPGDIGFDKPDNFRLNPSYLPLQLLARFSLVSPVWADVASSTQRLLLESSPKGFAADWVVWKTGQGWEADEKGAVGSYDAIRVYLWLGMLDSQAPGRDVLLNHFQPMVALTTQRAQPPERVDVQTGSDTGVGPVGFSAALLPLLASDPKHSALLAAQRQRVDQTPPEANAYYNQSLMLFGQGWDQQRYRFDKDGRVLPAWASSCKG